MLSPTIESSSNCFDRQSLYDGIALSLSVHIRDVSVSNEVFTLACGLIVELVPSSRLGAIFVAVICTAMYSVFVVLALRTYMYSLRSEFLSWKWMYLELKYV